MVDWNDKIKLIAMIGIIDRKNRWNVASEMECFSEISEIKFYEYNIKKVMFRHYLQ